MKSFVLVLSVLLLTIPETPTASDGNVCLSQEEQRLYRLIMDYRKSKKLPPIPLSASLSKVAQVHARDLADNFTFNPTGKCNPHSWSNKGEWTACCYTSDHKQAECMWSKPMEIAGYEGSGYEIAYYSSKGATAEEGLAGWKVSEGHNPLLINTGIWNKVKWNAIGIGIYKEYGLVWFGEVRDENSPGTCE